MTGPSSENAIPVFDRWLGSWHIAINRRTLDGAELRQAYDTVAPRWAGKLDRLGIPATYRRIVGNAVDEAGLRPVSGEPVKVLDCGVGTGALSLALVDAIGPEAAIAAVDISPRMLCEAERALAERGACLAPYLADIRDLPFGRDRFDVVMCAHVLEHLTDPAQAIAEMLRVLRPGGLLLALVTQRSLLGTYVQLKWRTHQVTPNTVATWLETAGARQVRRIPVGSRFPGGAWSVAMTGRNPACDTPIPR